MDLMKMVLGTVTPAISGKVAQAMGMDPKTVQRVLGMAIPVLLSGVLGASRKPEAADSFGQAFRDMGDNPLDALNNAVATDPSRVASAGNDMLESILGGGTLGTLVSKMADFGGMSKENSGSLMGLAGSVAMGSLGKAAREENLDAAGALKMLESQKGSIAAAIPPDLVRALSGTGVLEALDGPSKPAAAAAKPTPAPAPKPAAAPAPEPKKSGLSKWLLLAAAALLLLWLLPRFFGGPEEVPEPVVETAPAPATEEAEPAEAAETVAPETPATEEAAPADATEEAAPADATEEAAPADATEEAAPAETTEEAAPAETTEEAAAPETPPVFGTIESALTQLSTALGGVSDVASAEAALPQLQEVDSTLADAESEVAGLPDEARSVLQTAVSASLPTIQSTVDGLMADSGIGAVLQPVVDSIMAKLSAFAG